MKKILILAFLMLLALPALAQSEDVTADEVNEIAKGLYCPVCENIPLDSCGTAACEDWRYEIRLQLEQGLTEDAIVDDFINRFGERVVGTPQDPALRALSLFVPWLVTALSALAFMFWLVRRNPSKPAPNDTPPEKTKNTTYRNLLEQDLSG